MGNLWENGKPRPLRSVADSSLSRFPCGLSIFVSNLVSKGGEEFFVKLLGGQIAPIGMGNPVALEPLNRKVERLSEEGFLAYVNRKNKPFILVRKSKPANLLECVLRGSCLN